MGKKNEKVVKNRNAAAKALESKQFSPKVIPSKKVYSRSKIWKHYVKGFI